MAVISRRAAMVGALWNVAAMTVPLVSTLLLSIVIGRVLGTAALGEQSLIAYVGALVGGTVVIALTNCTQQVLAAARGADDWTRLAAVDRLAAVSHVVAGACAAAVVASIGLGRDRPWAWALLGLVLLVDAVGWLHGSRLVARHGWRHTARLRLVSQVAGSALGIAAVVAGAGLEGVFGAQLLSSVWLTLALARRAKADPVDPPGNGARAALRPLLRLWASFVMSVLLINIVDRRVELVFLDVYRPPHDLAVYAVAFSLVSVAVTVPTSLAGAMIPGIAAAGASGSAGALQGHLRRATRISVVAAVLLSAIVAGTGPAAVVVFWGADLRGAADILPWMTLSVLFVPLRALLTSYWVGMGNLTPVLWTTFAGAVVDVAAAWVLVPAWGVPGAVVANVSAQAVACAGIVVFTRRRLPDVGVAPAATARALVAGGLAAGAGLTVSGLIGGALGLLASAVTVGGVLVLYGVVVGLLPAEDTQWLRQVLPRPVHPLLVLVGGRARRPVADPVPEESL